MARNTSIIHIGIKGTVLALSRATGTIVWETPLKGSDFVNLVLDGDALFATTKGEVFCLDPSSGQIRWNNSLHGFGWGLATIATEANSVAAMARHRKQEKEQVAAAGAAAATAGAGVQQ